MKKLRGLWPQVSNWINRFLLFGVVYAQGDREIQILPPSRWERLADITLPQLITGIIRMALIAAAIIAFVFLVVGGIKWITSGGDKEGTAKAQSTITAALVGLVIVFASWAIIQLLEVFFGFSILRQIEIPTVGE